ncbi:MAG: hypothetical protein AB1814_08310 [Thermodesulfobacteriota bacterium]
MVRRQEFHNWARGLLLCAALTLCALPAMAAAGPKTKLDVVKSAKVTKADFQVKKHKGKDRLFVTVEVQNVSKAPKRFRVNIWLPNGVTGGGFYPRKTQPLAPGKSLAQTFPFNTGKMPSEATILVKELPLD